MTIDSLVNQIIKEYLQKNLRIEIGTDGDTDFQSVSLMLLLNGDTIDSKRIIIDKSGYIY